MGVSAIPSSLEKIAPDRALSVLRAAGEETRLRILNLLSRGELNVSDFVQILGQSQPRVSRHLKLLVESGLVERAREGSFAFYRLSMGTGEAAFLTTLLDRMDHAAPGIVLDMERLDTVKAARAQAAAAYFAEHAGQWSRIRSLHVDDSDVEAALLGVVGEQRFERMVDLGTGTGRILEIMADRINEGIGLDLSHEMIALARSSLETAGHQHCRVRVGDILRLPLFDNSADLVTIHQVLHFLDDPGEALREAARILAPGGLLLIADFAPHNLEFLRSEHAHRRLGIEVAEVDRWLKLAGLERQHHADLVPDPIAHGAVEASRLTVSLFVARKPARAVAA